MATSNVTTETDVANLALQRIGRAIISDIDNDGTKTSLACLRIFADTRDEVAVMLPWSNLMTRTAISTSAATDSLFAYKQTLADTVLRVIEVTAIDGSSENENWRREGTTLFYDLTTGYIRHIERQASVSIWDPLYLAALEARLAHKLSVYLTTDVQMHMAMQQEYVTLLSTAVLVRAVEENEANDKILAQLDASLAARYIAISGGRRRIAE